MADCPNGSRTGSKSEQEFTEFENGRLPQPYGGTVERIGKFTEFENGRLPQHSITGIQAAKQFTEFENGRLPQQGGAGTGAYNKFTEFENGRLPQHYSPMGVAWSSLLNLKMADCPHLGTEVPIPTVVY